MNDTEAKLRQEVRELKAEVSRLKQMSERGLALIVIASALIVPRLVVAAGGAILFALLVSPVRHLIFPSIFREPKKGKFAVWNR